MTVNGTNCTSQGNNDVFLAAYSTDGTFGWGRSLSGSGIDLGAGVAVDGDGNVVVVGRFANTCDFGGGLMNAGSTGEGYIAKYSGASGGDLFAKELGSAAVNGLGQVNGATVKSAKNIIMVGELVNTFDFGNRMPITATNSLGDAFAAKTSAAPSTSARGRGWRAHRLDSCGRSRRRVWPRCHTDRGRSLLHQRQVSGLCGFRGAGADVRRQ